MKTMRARKGLTLIEVLVIIFIFAVVLGLILPVLARSRENSMQNRCASNLNQIGKAMFMYSDVVANNGFLPTLGPKGDPYNSDPMLALNLLYGNYITDPRVFSCHKAPISNASLQAIQKTNKNGLLPNSGVFLSPVNCSYGYDPGHSPNQAMIALLADKPGVGRNSDNHGVNAGQNVLIGSGTIEFMSMPFQGADEKTADNIFMLNPNIPRDEDAYIRQR